MTHVIDGDQHAVALKILAKNAGSVTVKMPDAGTVVPPGPYMLFINRSTSSGPSPSVSKPVTVLGAATSCAG